MHRLLTFLALSFALGCLHTPVYGQWTFETVDPPFVGAKDVVVTGHSPTQVIGTYLSTEGPPMGFLREAGTFRSVPFLVPQSINASEHIVGVVQLTKRQGFLWRDGTLRILVGPRSTPFEPLPSLVEPRFITASGLVLGHYENATGLHGFVYNPVTDTYTTVSAPGATSTSLVGQTASGALIAMRTLAGGQRHAMRVEGGVFTEVALPGLTEFEVVGVTETGVERLVGNHFGVTPVTGFVFQDGALTVVQVPGALRTELVGIRGDGVMYGRYVDAEGHSHGVLVTSTSSGPPPQRRSRPGRQP